MIDSVLAREKWFSEVIIGYVIPSDNWGYPLSSNYIFRHSGSSKDRPVCAIMKTRCKLLKSIANISDKTA
ncbi:MAG: hypothetical protein K0R08_1178 [Solimicrobium sp.]|jgi:hypothetical protein|nr:hypothetical protein [Solimicrobium sp.]